MNKDNFTPVMTLAMKEMLMNCRDRELLRVSPSLNYDWKPLKSSLILDILKPRLYCKRMAVQGWHSLLQKKVVTI